MSCAATMPLSWWAGAEASSRSEAVRSWKSALKLEGEAEYATVSSEMARERSGVVGVASGGEQNWAVRLTQLLRFQMSRMVFLETLCSRCLGWSSYSLLGFRVSAEARENVDRRSEMSRNSYQLPEIPCT
eukprot:195943-Rhodomonas_salina.1